MFLSEMLHLDIIGCQLLLFLCQVGLGIFRVCNFCLKKMSGNMTYIEYAEGEKCITHSPEGEEKRTGEMASKGWKATTF